MKMKMKMKILTCLLFTLALANASTSDDATPKEEPVASKPAACILDALPRHAPVPLQCPQGYEHDKEDGLCYPKCKEGYNGTGPICSTECPPGFADTGALCTSMKRKGCCGTTTCDGCQHDHTDIGCFCSKTIIKESYGRGTGINLTCAHGEERNGKVCYPGCPRGYMVIGKTCWGGADLENYPVQCNGIGILYGQNKETCENITRELGNSAGLSSECVVAVFAFMGSAQEFQVAASTCGTNLNTAVVVVNRIINKTNAQTCNPVNLPISEEPLKCAWGGACDSCSR